MLNCRHNYLTRLTFRIVGKLSFFAMAIWATGAFASIPVAPPPVHINTDSQGVDVVTGALVTSQTVLSIGDSNVGLALHAFNFGTGWLHDYSATVKGPTIGTGGTFTVSIGGKSWLFTRSGTTYTANGGMGETLVQGATLGDFTFTMRDGTVVQFVSTGAQQAYLGYLFGHSILTSVTKPNGMMLNFAYSSTSTCASANANGTCQVNPTNYYRVTSVSSNTGYQIKFEYYLASASGFVTDSQLTDWLSLKKATAFNEAVEYCAPGALSCSFTNTWPAAQFSEDQTTVADPVGLTTTYTYSGDQITKIQNPDSSQQTATYDGSGRVQTWSNGVGTWHYGYADSGTTRTTTVTDPDAHTRVYVSDTGKGLVSSVTNELTKITAFAYDSFGRLTQVTQPETNYVVYTYDSRGNITQTSYVPKGASSAAFSTYASFDASCSDPRKCNAPNSSMDERGQTTDYTYDSTTSLLSEVKAPAPAAGGVRPDTHFDYTPYQAYYYQNGSGPIAASGQPILMLTGVRACQTLATCAGGADEAKVVYSYGPQAGGTPNNLLIATVTRGSGNGTLSAATAYGYDNIGNVTSVTDPLGNVSRSFYDIDRRLTQALSPDPDGSGPSKNRMVQFQYNADGTLGSVQPGTANPDGSGFSALQVRSYGYDTYGRKIRESFGGSGVLYRVYVDTSYDAFGRVLCSAQRMGSGTPPADACTAGTPGADGPDRIAHNVYNADGRVQKVQTGYTTAAQRDEVSYTYTDNGKRATLADSKGNLTTYEYDGLDRLLKTRLPNSSSGGSSTSDYEQLTYGVSGATTNLVTSRRLRDGNSVTYAYDNLGRLATMTPPYLTGNDNPITYTYDNLGELTQAADTTSGHTVSYTYDALGRTTSEVFPWRTKTMAYDGAGQLTALNYGDGFYVTYYYDTVGEMTAIYENGSNWLASYGYDDLGRRAWIGRPNGVSTGYTYDGVSRLTNLTQDLAGTANDLTIGLSYNAGGQITQRTSSNDAYAWTDSFNVNRSYTSNGLNQYTAISTITPTYDGRGNLTSAGGQSYAYTARNQLQNTSGGSSLFYDALGRLDYDAIGTPNCAALDNVGSNIDVELNCSTGATLRRYVYGPDNAPVVWYEGSGTSDKRWLLPDERGSVIAVTDSSGNATRINSYDEYGIPGSNNLGRFGYTGQPWLTEIGMYYARARIYSPTLGRFIQTDPIGYGDGPNWYNYVGGDPINSTDPTGLKPPNAPVQDPQPSQEIVVTGHFTPRQVFTDPGIGFDSSPTQNIWLNPTVRRDADQSLQSEIVVIGYWKKQKAAGNPIARLGLQFGWGSSSDWLTDRSKEILIGAILGTPVKGRYPTLEQGLATYGRIRVALMYADQAARLADHSGVPGLLSPGQVYDYHVSVFARFGLPSTAFGGSPIFGTRTEAYTTNTLFGWCRGCDQ